MYIFIKKKDDNIKELKINRRHSNIHLEICNKTDEKVKHSFLVLIV